MKKSITPRNTVPLAARSGQMRSAGCSIRTCALTVLMAGIVLAVMVPTKAAAKVLPCAETTAILYSTATATASTTTPITTSLTPVAGTKIAFKQGGKTAGCAIVSFSAEAKAAANETMALVVILDNSKICGAPNQAVAFVTSNATATDGAARAMNFVCAGVTPGAHTAEVFFASVAGGAVELDYRTTILQYVK